MSAVVSTEVHLWVARLDPQPPVLAALSAGLTADERERASAIGSAVGQRRFVATRGILRSLLAARLGCAPQDVGILRPRDGKPALTLPAGGDGLRFNLSHCEDVAVFALSVGAEVGVDVERVRPLWNVHGLAARVLADSERAALAAAADPDEALLVRWTVKEAVLKGLGEGLTRAPASVVVDPDGGEQVRPVRIDGHWSTWRVAAFCPTAGYVGAVALQASGFSVRLRAWSPDAC